MIHRFLNPPQKEHFCPVNTSPPLESSGETGKTGADFIIKSSGDMLSEKQTIWKRNSLHCQIFVIS